jgi:phosphatidylinositol alpha-1,6-mannosyltransferase
MIEAPPRLCLGATSLMAGGGGIARVARLMGKALAPEVAEGRVRLRTISLYDRDRTSDLGLDVMAARGSQVCFTAAIHLAALGNTHFLYDSLAMTRAHQRLPIWRRPLLAWIHGIEVWETARDIRVRASRRADVLVANSAYTRERAERVHGGFARAEVCWLGTEGDAPSSLARPLGGPPTVLMLGRLEQGRDKGHRALIACWPAVVSAVPDARLLIVGTGSDLEDIRERVAVSPVAGRIELRGFVAEADVEEVWAQATVFAMPSRGEGFGLVYVEAMRHGVPVVASVHDAAPEINVEGETGYNVDLDRPAELPERIIHLLRNPALASELGARGRTRWAQHFRFSAFRQRFLPLVRRFVAGVDAGR